MSFEISYWELVKAGDLQIAFIKGPMKVKQNYGATKWKGSQMGMPEKDWEMGTLEAHRA